jgi:hypothetical protein
MMTGYSRTLLITLAVLLAGFGGFNFLVDPYGLHSWAIPHINEERTRDFEDGRRIQVGHQLGLTDERSVILGSSRVVDGFPRTIQSWPGGLYNAGMRGTNAYELAHAAALAGADPDLRCVVIGLDMWEFAAGEKFKPAFPISRLADGSRLFSSLRATMAPNTFMRSVQTVIDNATGAGAPDPFPETYPAGRQHDWFVGTPRGHPIAASLRVDPARVDLLFAVLQRLADSGVQIIGFLHPVHAFNEEALFAVGRAEDYHAFRTEMARRFAALSGDPIEACAPGGQGVLWDFAGFQAPAVSALPGETATRPHPTHHEPAHYRPEIGVMLIERMLNGADDGDLGVRLTPQTALATSAAIDQRRLAYLQTDDGQLLQSLTEQYATGPAPAPSSWPLTPADLRGVEALLEDVVTRQGRLSREEAS